MAEWTRPPKGAIDKNVAEAHWDSVDIFILNEQDRKVVKDGWFVRIYISMKSETAMKVVEAARLFVLGFREEEVLSIMVAKFIMGTEYSRRGHA